MAEVFRVDWFLQPVALVTGVTLAGVIWGITFGESPLLTLLAGGLTILTVALLWRPGQPPMLLLVATVHLLQVIAILVYANLIGVHVDTFSDYGVNMERGTLAGIFACLAFVLGMTVGNMGAPVWTTQAAQDEASRWTPRSAFRFFGVTFVIGACFNALSTISESVRQLFLAGGGIQWIGVFVLAYVCVRRNQGYGFLAVAILLEIVVGFTGFFGEFRNVFFALFVALAAARPRLTFRSLLILLAAVTAALILSSFWSAIKKDYRAFLNAGTKQQVVLVPWEDRLAYLARRVDEADGKTFIDGLDALARRMGYVEFLGATLNFVPDGRPHESGAMAGAAVGHILFPRLLFPDKPPLPNDTAVTRAYTGLPMMITPGTSISIGYAGELYIDFGSYGMLAFLFALGTSYSLALRVVQKQSSSALIGFGASVTLLMPGLYFETALAKVVGGVCTSFIILILMSRFVLPFAVNALAWKERKLVPTPWKQ